MSSPPFPRAGSARSALLPTEPHSSDPRPIAQIENLEAAGIMQARLEQAYRTQKHRLHRFLRYKVGDDLANDMVQDAFMRMANTGHVHQIEEPVAYLWRVVRNLLFERWRKQKHERLIFSTVEAEFEAACAPEQEWALDLADMRALYKEAVDSLPDKTRYVFMMCRIDGMSHRQISEELGITIATVEYHMGKALTHLARVMDAQR